MPKSNKDRQKAWRERQKKRSTHQLNFYISKNEYKQFQILKQSFNESNSAMFSRLLEAYYTLEKIIATVSDQEIVPKVQSNGLEKDKSLHNNISSESKNEIRVIR